MMKLPEYGNCIANLACSILRYYGCDAPNPTLRQADRLLNRPYKNVVLLLLDGMGISTLNEHLPSGFFHQNLRCSYTSTYPPYISVKWCLGIRIYEQIRVCFTFFVWWDASPVSKYIIFSHLPSEFRIS